MSLKNWSTTAASNTSAPPNGAPESTTKIADFNNICRQIMADTRTLAASDSITAAGTTDIGSKDNTFLTVNGTTTITALGTVSAGIWKVLIFAEALTFTHSGTSLILPGSANITTAAGDAAFMLSLGSGNWRCLQYNKVSGISVNQFQIQTAQATTSGYYVDWTSIPTWVKRITIMLKNVECTAGGASSSYGGLELRIGDSGGLENTDYYGDMTVFQITPYIHQANSSQEFRLIMANSFTYGNGVFTLTKMESSGNIWMFDGQCRYEASNSVVVPAGGTSAIASGYKELSGTLDRLRIQSGHSDDTFIAGSINVAYE